MANSVAGSILGVVVDGEYITCQTDATLNLINNLNEDEICKPAPNTGINAVGYVTRTLVSKDWNMTFSAQAFLASAAANESNNIDLVRRFINYQDAVTVIFQPSEGNYAGSAVGYEGDGILSTITQNAPTDGPSTYDVEIQGNGPLNEVVLTS